MWANNIDGEIKVFKYLPHSWEGENVYFKGFSSSPVAIREQEGFFEIVDPQYDPETEELGELYLEDNKYHYIVKQK